MSNTVKKPLAPLDPDVNIPAAIRAQSARASAMHQTAYETEPQKPDGEKAPETPPKNPETPPQTEKKPDEQNNNPPKSPENKPTVTPEGNPDDWEHKYNSIKGRYDRVNSTVGQLNDRIRQLEHMLSQQTKAPAAEPAKPQRLVTDDERKDYGEDFLDVAARAARENISPELAELRSKLERMENSFGSVERTVHNNKQQSITQTMDENVPNWREINKDSNFLAWLNLPDPYSGAIRLQMLQEAHRNGEAQRVLQFFKGFLSDEAVTAPAGDQPGKVTSLGNEKTPLENFAAPGRAKAPAASSAPGEKETISRAQIANFYRMVNQGHYRGNDAEKNRLEQMIFDAERDGRIV